MGHEDHTKRGKRYTPPSWLVKALRESRGIADFSSEFDDICLNAAEAALTLRKLENEKNLAAAFPEPKVFIGSSSESQDLPDKIAYWLEQAGAKPLRWDQAFGPGILTLPQLVQITSQVDGAVLVFTADDWVGRGEAATTGRQPRDNVVFEFGLFAGSLGLERAIICHDGEAKIPVDLHGLTHIDLRRPESAQRILTDWVQRHLQARGAGVDPIVEVNPAFPMPEFQKDGIVEVYPAFPMPEFQKLLTKATEVNILQTFMPETGHLEALGEPLIDAIKRGCRVQVLICHPESAAVEIRQTALAAACQTGVREAVGANVRTFGRIYQGLPDEGKTLLTVAAYTTLPSLCIYQADDTFFFGCYFHDMLAINGLQTHVEGRGTAWGKYLCNEFAKLRDHKETTNVDLQNPEIWLDSARSLAGSAHD